MRPSRSQGRRLDGYARTWQSGRRHRWICDFRGEQCQDVGSQIMDEADDSKDGPSRWLGEGAALPADRRAALQALGWAGAAPLRQPALCSAATARGFGESLVLDQIDQLFLDAVEANDWAGQLPAGLLELLKRRRLAVAAGIMQQEHVLGGASTLLDQHAVAHVVFKGALVRHLLYAKPHLRPSADVDLLVAPADAPAVVRLLVQHGCSLHQTPKWDTHEVSLSRHGVALDLHWNLLRPGRMRHDIASELLASRLRRHGLWSPADRHLTAVMLVHPAITDYVTGPLISIVDIDRWLRRCQVDWDDVVGLLERMGLRAAAWTTLRWTRHLFATPVPDDVMAALAPSFWRRRYLEAWLGQHPARLYHQWPNLVRVGFSLALQDRAGDMARAAWRLARKERLTF
jgi:hypothetical protein